MNKSIFDYEVRIDIRKELNKLNDILYQDDSIWCNRFLTLYEYINDTIFPEWKYKSIFIDFEDYLDVMNIDLENPLNSSEIDLLSVLEVLINLWPSICCSVERKNINSKVIGYFESTIPAVLEKLNYEIITDGDKERLVKRDADVDSILDLVPSDCAKLLLDYNDIRNNTLKNKKSILKELDLYLEKNKKDFQNVDKETYNTIEYIVNNMGVNHPIKKEPFKDYDEEKLIDWYDKCFKLIIHFIRKKEVNKINEIRKEFDKD